MNKLRELRVYKNMEERTFYRTNSFFEVSRKMILLDKKRKNGYLWNRIMDKKFKTLKIHFPSL